jgi:glycosyltransferase involved in cell wall biosynthesis
VRDPIPYYMLMLSEVSRRAAQFDILHFHIDQFHFPVFQDMPDRVVTTMHGRQDMPDLKHLYAGFPQMHVVSISNAQRLPIAHIPVTETIYHGLPRDLHGLSRVPRGGYLAFLGRISPEKRVDRAIAIASAVGVPLKIAAKVDKVDQEYFKSEIEPLLKLPGVEYIGEIDDQEKTAFLQGARALLFPIDWPEPFGLVMIEAMACGTPVLAFQNGSDREVIYDGVTGFVVKNVEEGILKMGSVLALDRGRVRRRFEERFTATRMAKDYVRLYRRIISAEGRHGATDRAAARAGVPADIAAAH